MPKMTHAMRAPRRMTPYSRSSSSQQEADARTNINDYQDDYDLSDLSSYPFGKPVKIANNITLISRNPVFDENNGKYNLSKSKSDNVYKYKMNEKGKGIIKVQGGGIEVIDDANPGTNIPKGKALLLLNRAFKKKGDGVYEFNVTIPDSCIQSTEYLMNKCLGTISGNGKKYPFLAEANGDEYEGIYSHDIVSHVFSHKKKGKKGTGLPLSTAHTISLNLSTDEFFRDRFVKESLTYKFIGQPNFPMIGDGLVALNSKDENSIFHVSTVLAAYTENGMIKSIVVSDANEIDRTDIGQYLFDGKPLQEGSVIKLPKIRSARMMVLHKNNYEEWRGDDYMTKRNFIIGLLKAEPKEKH
ncbi:hypothetical protein [Serratia inhibens]